MGGLGTALIRQYVKSSLKGLNGVMAFSANG